MPSFIQSVTSSAAFGYFARTVLTYMFWASGLAKLIDFNAGVSEMAYFGLEPALLFNIAVIITQIGGSALIIANRWTWLGAGALAVFTALTIPIAHTFWLMDEPIKTVEFYVVMEHITVIGALMVVAWKSALEPQATTPDARVFAKV
ncbi:transmembrane protein [Pararhizobium capsulatum DSM 1112]|uniref:Transmembrane protein n=1 Tax=Pararhizobium capsulatum DSM 1112 TaxID=1121113 RepID=A0ABU0BQ98_9HYPH|nr:DoxX family protein [Pararhizobium capsulatum]MDQ0319640.1 transmembrane protein [Pararhizobium capsulatum DSM 1112]